MSKILLFSGGLDSTLALYELATENERDMIHALTVIGLGNTEYQQKSEYQARKRVRLEFKRRGITNIQYHTIDVSTDFRGQNTQAPVWLGYTLPSMQDGDELHMTYLSSDGKDFWWVKGDLELTFNAFCKLKGITAKLKFEYQSWTKGDIIKKLKKYKLFRLPSYCGDPGKNLKPCGKCMKCVSVKRWTAYPDRGENT